MRGESREAISKFRSRCQEGEISIEITVAHALLSVQGDDYELADTQQSLSSRLKRGHRRLIGGVLIEQ